MRKTSVIGGAETTEPIAIVGIGCRYPGCANVDELWAHLVAGHDLVGAYPGGRFPGLDRTYRAARERAGTLLTDQGGFLPDVDQFDSQFFEIAPRESVYIDPQHRLLLEVAWAALEDAGVVRAHYEGSRTGVFVGQWTGEYESRLLESATPPDFYGITGSARASASGRVSFSFGFEGPSVTVDSACSSSLVAVHLACQGLLGGECDMALAGGTNLILGTEITELFTQASMLSADGRCKFGDASADGFVRSEGAGMVVLKRLSRAREDGDRIYAVIRGSVTNNDGRTSGLLVTPSREGQRRMLLEAWQRAGIEPARLRYIEAHGTGTGVGDPVEIGALADALEASGVEEPCRIGSIKTNIGHTESAAGVAGLIKAALVLYHRRVPPSLHCAVPNPKIDWQHAPVRIASEAADLSGEPGPLLAGVSSFGITGTNAHIVLAEAEQVFSAASEDDGVCLLPVSARSPEALTALLRAHLDQARTAPSALQEVCYTAAVRRNHHEHRAAIVAASAEELEERLAAAVAGEASEGVAAGRASSERPRVVFVAPGQGSQWPEMARELYASQPAFREEFDCCDAAIRKETGWSLCERLLGEDAERHLAEIDVIQPSLFAMSLSLAALWRAWGVEPDAVVGHSMGEVAAACLAGALTLPDAAAVICRRSRLMKTLPRGEGGMATVDLPLAEAEALLGGYPGLSIAASNGPRTTVLSGDVKALEALLAVLQAREVYGRLVKVDVASHSAQVDPILDSLRSSLAHLQPQPPRIPMLSTVTGEFVSEDADGSPLDAEYWVRNLRQCVLLAPVVDRLAEGGHAVFLELSPHPILLPSVEAAARVRNPQAVVIPSLRREKPACGSMLSGLGALYVQGFPVDWARLFPRGGRLVALPQYPFQRERAWPEPAAGRNSRAADPEAHPLLGRRFTSSLQPGTSLWECEIGLSAFPWLGDHRVQQAAVLPASAYVEMALAAARELLPEAQFSLADMAFRSTAELPESGSRTFQLALLPETRGYAVEVRSRESDGEAAWTLHVTGRLVCAEDDEISGGRELALPLSEMERMKSGAAFYAMTARGGLHYGPAFQRVESFTSGAAEGWCRLRADADADSRYVLHPAILDGCLQAKAALQPISAALEAGDTCLPVGFAHIRIHGRIERGEALVSVASLTGEDPARDRFHVDLRLLGAGGAVRAEIRGMEIRRVGRHDAARQSLYRMSWLPAQGDAAGDLPATTAGDWILFADRGGIAEAMCRSLEFAGARCTLVWGGRSFARRDGTGFRQYEIRPEVEEDLRQLFAEVPAPTKVVHLWALDREPADAGDAAALQRAQLLDAEHLAQVARVLGEMAWMAPPRLWMVTVGVMAVAEGEAPRCDDAPVWGLGRTVAREYPELRASLADLSARPSVAEARELARRIALDGREDRIALRGRQISVLRLEAHAAAAPAPRPLAEEEGYRFETVVGSGLDQLALRAFVPAQPGPGEVTVNVTAAGMNFLDVARAMGLIAGLAPGLGLECAGRISAIGAGVEGFTVGDAVIGITPSAGATLLSSQVTLPASSVFLKPSCLSDEQAATVGIAFLTAVHSLEELARIRPGERVLIHAAAGGVGAAAIQVAHSAGAEVFATVSTPEKEAFVRSLGVRHVFHSRSLDFADRVLEATGGRGADVVLNSLSGEFIAQGLKVLAPYGRFVELGKRDVYENLPVGLFALRRNVSLHVVDLAAALEEQPEQIRRQMNGILDRLARGEWQPLPVTAFPADQPAEPFQYMAQARHIGRVAVRFGREAQVLPPANPRLFHADACYLITGGLGGIALETAAWMARNGAGAIALMSRRTPGDDARAAIRSVEAAGAVVHLLQGDVTQAADVERALGTIRTSGRPLRGILHMAAVVDDVLLRNLSPDRLQSVLAPKVAGTWSLHTATLEEPLDFFVLYSSIASLHPQPGMASYAGANAFLDAFAHYRRALGLPALAINWGGWDGTGLARIEQTARSIDGYQQQGIATFSVAEGLAMLAEALRSDVPQLVAIPFDWATMAAFYGTEQAPPLYDLFLTNAAAGPTTSARAEVLDRLAAADSAAERAEVMEACLVETLGAVLKLPVRRIDRERPMGTMGLDSLMGLEFVRRLSRMLEISVPATVVFSYPTVRRLAANLLGRLAPIAEAESPAIPAPVSAVLLPADGTTEDDALAELMGRSRGGA